MTDRQDSNHACALHLLGFALLQPILDVARWELTTLAVGCWRENHVFSDFKCIFPSSLPPVLNTTISKCYRRSRTQADLHPYNLQHCHTCNVSLRLEEMNC
jgi:hypothetical protein